MPPMWSATDASMTLRDYLAAQAMQALIGGRDLSAYRNEEVAERIAYQAYKIADVMLTMRLKSL